MKKELNLFGRSLEDKKFFLFKKKVNIFIYSIIGLFILVSGITLFGFFYFQKIFNDNNTEITSLKARIIALNKNESYAVIINDRILTIKDIFKNRKSYLKALTDMEQFFVPNFKITGYQMEVDGDLKLDGVCENNEALTLFNEYVRKVCQERGYVSAVYGNVSRTAAGEYSISLTVKKK